MNVSKVGARLQQIRLQHNISVADLANKMFISPQAVYKWEQGKGLPTVDNLIWLSDFYKVTIDYLVGRNLKRGE